MRSGRRQERATLAGIAAVIVSVWGALPAAAGPRRSKYRNDPDPAQRADVIGYLKTLK